MWQKYIRAITELQTLNHIEREREQDNAILVLE